MADNLASLQVQLELQSAQFTAEMQKVNGQLNKLNKDVGGISAGFTKLGTVLKGAAVLGAFVAVAKGVSSMVDGISKSIDAMDEMSKAAQKVGVAVETLSSLKFAAEQSGVGFEALQTGLKKLNQNLSDFDTGTSEAAESLRKMGIAVGDTTEQSLAKIADQFEKMPDGVQKTALAMNIFGKAGADLVPLLNAGSQGIEALQKRAKELGIVFDDISAKQAELFNDKMAEMKTALTGVFTQISIGLLPVLSALTEELADSIKAGTGWQTVGQQIGDGLLNVAQGAAAAIDAFIALQRRISSFVQTASDMFTVIGGKGKDKAEAANRIANQFIGATPEEVVTSYSQKMKEIADGIRARMDVGEFQTLGGGRTGGSGGAGGGGKGGKATPFDAWIEGLSKTQEEISLLAPKAEFLRANLEMLAEMGLEGGNAWKTYYEEYKKIQDAMAGDDPFYKIEKDIAAARGEMDRAQESIFYLVEKLRLFKEIGDEQGIVIVEAQIKKLSASTKDTATDFEKLGESIKTAIENNAGNAVNTFIDSLGKGKLSFGDFAASILKDIAKMIVRLLVLKPLMDGIMRGIGSFGGGSGSVHNGYGVNALGNPYPGGTSLPQGIYTKPTFFKFANGGVFGSRTGLMGEAGPEAILPLRRNSQGKLGVEAANSGVQVNVYNNTGSEVETRTSENSDGTKQIDIYIEKKVRDMVNGGGLDRSMRSSFGLTRVGA
jgi:hypothetical protein